MKKCSRCQQEKPESEFYKSTRRKSGYFPYCKPCHREYVKETQYIIRVSLTPRLKLLVEQAAKENRTSVSSLVKNLIENQIVNQPLLK